MLQGCQSIKLVTGGILPLPLLLISQGIFYALLFLSINPQD